MSKTEADALAEKLRTQWREEAKRKSAPDPRRTVGMLADRYTRDHVRRPGRQAPPDRGVGELPADNQTLENGGPEFEDFPLDSVTTDNLEAVRVLGATNCTRPSGCTPTEKRTAASCCPSTGAARIGIEHMMALLRHMFAWAAKRNLASATPFKRNGEAAVTVRAEGPRGRDRRLVGDEEARLLAAAQPHLRDLSWRSSIPAADGELLVPSVVGRAARRNRPAGREPKTARTRAVPIMSRMRGVLDSRRKGPDGREHAPDCFVFGSEAGEAIKRVRHAWDNTCRRAKSRTSTSTICGGSLGLGF